MGGLQQADAARLISQGRVQPHGGMGMSEVLTVSHTLRQLTKAAQRFGDADHHLARYAALLQAQRALAWPLLYGMRRVFVPCLRHLPWG